MFGPPEDQLDESTFRRYEGNCHCGKFKFAISIPPLETLNDCACSVCFMNGLRGLIWFPIGGKRKFEVLRGDEDKDLTSYSFGHKALQHKFCKECGTSLFARKGDDIGVNAKALAEMDHIEHEVPLFHHPEGKGAAHWDPPYAPSAGTPVKWTGPPLKESEVEYQGHCHCGQIRFCLHWKPMDQWEGNSCNCSWCWKRGNNAIYPDKTAVQFEIPEGAATYYVDRWGENGRPTFCSRCGTFVFVDVRGWDKCPINVRSIDGVGLKTLEELKGVKYYDGRKIDPQYNGEDMRCRRMLEMT